MKKDYCDKKIDMFMLTNGWCHEQPDWWLKEQ
jgi:hypothetical protein